MKILVTGGSGFVGRRLVARLVGDGHEVTITSGGTHVCPGVKRVLYRGLEGIDWTAVSGQDVVFHQSANNDTRCKDESEMYRANVYGPIKLFVTAASSGCKNFVYASSTAVYGNEPAPYTSSTKVAPLNVYGRSKASFDEFAMKFADDFKVNVTGLRYCNVYGPGEDHKGARMSMVGQLLRSMLAFRKPQLFSTGDQRRDWVFVDDVVEANVLAMQKNSGGRIYNLGSGSAVSFNEVVAAINELLSEKAGRLAPMEPAYVDCPFPSEYQSYTCCEMKEAECDLGLVVKYDLRKGIDSYLSSLLAT